MKVNYPRCCAGFTEHSLVNANPASPAVLIRQQLVADINVVTYLVAGVRGKLKTLIDKLQI